MTISAVLLAYRDDADVMVVVTMISGQKVRGRVMSVGDEVATVGGISVALRYIESVAKG
ncbi:hypothetical protein [Streptomyces sp. I8-5]|uniref:hypothetical protein n=1 Tax=Streptomyces sp. I8-5 TaxID=3104277 RepID=UPI0038664943